MAWFGLNHGSLATTEPNAAMEPIQSASDKPRFRSWGVEGGWKGPLTMVSLPNSAQLARHHCWARLIPGEPTFSKSTLRTSPPRGGHHDRRMASSSTVLDAKGTDISLQSGYLFMLRLLCRPDRNTLLQLSSKSNMPPVC